MKRPGFAAWRHLEARDGFEIVVLRSSPSGYVLDGDTAAVEDGHAWAVRYSLGVDPNWLTRTARISGTSRSGNHTRSLQSDGTGGWLIDGSSAPHLDGCLDVDLESSALTNAFPVHRLGLRVGDEADAPAAYVRALDLRVERLDQRYRRLEDADGRQRYHYMAPAFNFECELNYDDAGLLLEYPGIAIRVA